MPNTQLQENLLTSLLDYLQLPESYKQEFLVFDCNTKILAKSTTGKFQACDVFTITDGNWSKV